MEKLSSKVQELIAKYCDEDKKKIIEMIQRMKDLKSIDIIFRVYLHPLFSIMNIFIEDEKVFLSLESRDFEIFMMVLDLEATQNNDRWICKSHW